MQRLLVSVIQLAALAGVNKRTVWRDVTRGRCRPPLYIGGRALWSLERVEPWIAAHRGASAREPPPSTTSWPEYVRIEEISAMLGGVSERTLCRCMRPLRFPKPLGKPRSPKLWRTAEVLAWVEAQARLASTLDRQE